MRVSRPATQVPHVELNPKTPTFPTFSPCLRVSTPAVFSLQSTLQTWLRPQLTTMNNQLTKCSRMHIKWPRVTAGKDSGNSWYRQRWRGLRLSKAIDLTEASETFPLITLRICYHPIKYYPRAMWTFPNSPTLLPNLNCIWKTFRSWNS